MRTCLLVMIHVGCDRGATLTTAPTMKPLTRIGVFDVDELVFDVFLLCFMFHEHYKHDTNTYFDVALMLL